MSDLSTPTGDGHTMLSDDDRTDLLQPDIATQQELYEAEHLNIVRALLRPKQDFFGHRALPPIR